MRVIALWLCFLALAGCAARPSDVTLLSPCPPAALPACQVHAAGCDSAPFCYRTLGRVDCYRDPELARRTVEELVSPAACYVRSSPVRKS